MKRIRPALILIAFAWTCLSATEINLLEKDWTVATELARETNSYLYIAFLGDGWSVGSKRFSKAILDTPEFRDFASNQLVYCPVLARSTPKLDKGKLARLQSLVIHLDVKSYPTFILMAPDETEILRHGYRSERVQEYVALLEALLPVKTARPESGD